MKLIKLQLFLALLIFTISVQAQDINFSNLTGLPVGKSAVSSANDGDNIYIVNGFSTIEQYTTNILNMISHLILGLN